MDAAGFNCNAFHAGNNAEIIAVTTTNSIIMANCLLVNDG